MTRDAPRGSEADGPEPPTGPRWLPSEARVLKAVFALTTLAALGVVALDFYAYAGREGFTDWPSLPSAPVSAPTTIAPPKPDDQVRRFTPNASPSLAETGAPALPGVAEPDKLRAGDPMVFLRGPGGAASAVGRITVGVAEALERFLDAQGGEVTALHLHSPGGSVRDALAMARTLRARGVTTVVPDGAHCASSCPLVLAGGKDRRVGRAALVGLHQVYLDERAPTGLLSDGVAHAQSVSAEIQERLAALDVDPAVWIHAMRTPSREIYYLTQEELTGSRLSLGEPE